MRDLFDSKDRNRHLLPFVWLSGTFAFGLAETAPLKQSRLSGPPGDFSEPGQEWSHPKRTMPTQTVTRSVESEFEPGRLYDVLAKVENIPKWAPVFADSVEPIDGVRYRVAKGGESFQIEVVLHPSAGAVDYIREMPNGRRGGAFIRVTPRPLGGSSITMTVPIAPNTTEADVAKVLEQELADLDQLARS
jgi:hypothetical protein